MSRFRLTVAYDGQPFAGWQSQPGVATVQATLEAALAAVAGGMDAPGPAAIRVHGSGRTDAGVHATGQVAHFDAPPAASLDARAWQRALNVHLPPAVRVMACEPVPGSFHARFDAVSKTYVYRIHHADVLPPHEAGRAWHLFGKLDHAVIEAGLDAVVGLHDFSAFAANRGDLSDARSRQRTILQTRFSAAGPSLGLAFTGDGFLYRMVRLLTGALIRCARGRAPLAWFEDLLHHPQQTSKCRFCAPADGLFLEAVAYPTLPREDRNVPAD